MKKNTRINVKNTDKRIAQKPISESTLITSSKKIDIALDKRNKQKSSAEEFTEWK